MFRFAVYIVCRRTDRVLFCHLVKKCPDRVTVCGVGRGVVIFVRGHQWPEIGLFVACRTGFAAFSAFQTIAG